jgi:anti-sigma B factor antagonist
MSETAATPPLRIQWRRQDTTAVVAVTGEVDTTTAPLLYEAIVEALAGNPAILVVHLGAVDFMDSAGIAVLAVSLKRAAERQAKLRLVITRPHLQEIFTLTGLERVFAIFPDVDAACHPE